MAMIPAWEIPVCVYCNKRFPVPGSATCAQCIDPPKPEPESVEWVGPRCDAEGEHAGCAGWCRNAYTKETYR